VQSAKSHRARQSNTNAANAQATTYVLVVL